MSKQPGIPEDQLRACLQDTYELYPVTLEFLPIGKDYNAGVYRVVNEQGTAYLLKVTSRPLYEPACLVPAHLRDQGITSVVAPVQTSSHALWTKLMDWTVIIYPWISGESTLTGMTYGQWEKVGSIFKQIHQVILPPVGFESLRKETFDPMEYAQWIHAFEAQLTQEPSDESPSQCTLRSSWMMHQSTIHTAVTRLQTLAEMLRSRPWPYVICHADLHARNLIRDQAGQVFVIDWDEVMLAPKERDFIFVRQPQAEAFFRGYRAAEVDWRLLTYYLWERVVQDLIEDTKNVCFRDDLAEETKAEIAQGFDASLTEGGGNIAAAYQASARIAHESLM